MYVDTHSRRPRPRRVVEQRSERGKATSNCLSSPRERSFLRLDHVPDDPCSETEERTAKMTQQSRFEGIDERERKREDLRRTSEEAKEKLR